ncbi:MAG: VWA domain-containing protein [Gammaproteobacteria bacterium]|nr:VWA domain-containing protein [Gammaproteobacteria bacterium]
MTSLKDRLGLALRVCGAIAALALAGLPAQPASAAGETPRDSLLVLDASGSMWGQIDGVNKIVIAKDVVEALTYELPAQQRLGLVAYGHRRKSDCSDIETLAEVGTDREALRRQIRTLTPRGMTPLSASVQHAAEKLDYRRQAATVILSFRRQGDLRRRPLCGRPRAGEERSGFHRAHDRLRRHGRGAQGLAVPGGGDRRTVPGRRRCRATGSGPVHGGGSRTTVRAARGRTGHGGAQGHGPGRRAADPVEAGLVDDAGRRRSPAGRRRRVRGLRCRWRRRGRNRGARRALPRARHLARLGRRQAPARRARSSGHGRQDPCVHDPGGPGPAGQTRCPGHGARRRGDRHRLAGAGWTQHPAAGNRAGRRAGRCDLLRRAGQGAGGQPAQARAAADAAARRPLRAALHAAPTAGGAGATGHRDHAAALQLAGAGYRQHRQPPRYCLGRAAEQTRSRHHRAGRRCARLRQRALQRAPGARQAGAAHHAG